MTVKLKEIMETRFYSPRYDQHLKDVAKHIIDNDLNYAIVSSYDGFYYLYLTDITSELLKSNPKLVQMTLPKLLEFTEDDDITKITPYMKTQPAILVRRQANSDMICGVITDDIYYDYITNA